MAKRRSPRQRRLASDLDSLLALRRASSLFAFTSYGDPPERYRVVLSGRGLALDPEQGVVPQDRHVVDIVLGAAYPRIRPDLEWLSPVFHPNISEAGLVCLGGYSTDWVPSLSMDRLCTMLWDMVRWANYDVRSPYNLKAARWAKVQTSYAFPTDSRQLRDRLAPSGTRPQAGDGPDREARGIVFLDGGP